MPGMLAEMRRCFERVSDPVACQGLKLSDCLMSGWRCSRSSTRRCCSSSRTRGGSGRRATGFGGRTCAACSGSSGRRRTAGCGSVWTSWTRRSFGRPFKRLFALAQRGGALKEFEWLGGRHLLSVDGTGHFSSPTVHCGHCCVKNHKDGTRTYYHQSLCAVLVHRSGARFCRWFRRSRSARRTGRGRTTASGTRRSVCCGSFGGSIRTCRWWWWRTAWRRTGRTSVC